MFALYFVNTTRYRILNAWPLKQDQMISDNQKIQKEIGLKYVYLYFLNKRVCVTMEHEHQILHFYVLCTFHPGKTCKQLALVPLPVNGNYGE